MRLAMRFISVLLLCVVICTTHASGFGRDKRYAGQPRNEAELVGRVLNCLSYKDSISYYGLFPPLDTLWRMVTHNANQSPDAQKQLNELRDHPTVLIDLDPYYNHSIMTRFREVLQKGEDSGVNWKGIILQRYELVREGIIPGLEGLRLVIPERFKGFVFVRDMLGSTTYCITITNIQKVQGYFCGGEVMNVLEANTVDDFMAKEAAERKYLRKMHEAEQKRIADSISNKAADTAVAAKPEKPQDSVSTVVATKPVSSQAVADSAKAAKRKLLLSAPTSADEDKSKIRWEVVDRKLYKGLFDDDISVELYVRYMRDPEGKVRNWDGLYKFGDMQDYIKLEIYKEDGKWMMEEPAGLMELELNQKVYMGSWTNGDNQTGYDVELTQKDLSQAKMMKLDRILENNAGGDTRKQVIVEKPSEDTASAGVKKDTVASRDPLKDPPPKEEEKAKQPKKDKEEEGKEGEKTKEDKPASRPKDSKKDEDEEP